MTIGRITQLNNVPSHPNRTILVTGSGERYIVEGTAISPLDPPTTELCKCCAVAPAIRDGYCFCCAEHREADVKALKAALARCLPFVEACNSLLIEGSWFDGLTRLEADFLIAFIESECKDD